MNYWLFSVMYDNLPKTWAKMVQMGIAAQHYPKNWTNEAKNLKHIKRLKRGDQILAAFHKHRFGGYGTLTSGFYRGGPSMQIKGRNGVYEFQERFDCDWTTLPLRGGAPYVDLHELKKKGFSIDLTIGLCVKKIDKATFEEVRDELDQAGATLRATKEDAQIEEQPIKKRILLSQKPANPKLMLRGPKASIPKAIRVAFERIEALARSYEIGSPVMPPSVIFNEGWMLRLVLDRLAASGIGPDEHILAVPQDCRWYSEALLPTIFLPISRGDLKGEGWSHVDGVIGNFNTGIDGARKLKLNPDTRHFVVIEAKMFSPISPRVRNAPGYNQVARNIACMAETMRNLALDQLITLGFCVLAPQAQLDEGLAEAYLDKKSISAVVEGRVEGYGASREMASWFEDLFKPVLDRLTIKQVSWEDTLGYLIDIDSGAKYLKDFYDRCLKISDIEP